MCPLLTFSFLKGINTNLRDLVPTSSVPTQAKPSPITPTTHHHQPPAPASILHQPPSASILSPLLHHRPQPTAYRMHQRTPNGSCKHNTISSIPPVCNLKPPAGLKWERKRQRWFSQQRSHSSRMSIQWFQPDGCTSIACAGIFYSWKRRCIWRAMLDTRNGNEYIGLWWR